MESKLGLLFGMARPLVIAVVGLLAMTSHHRLLAQSKEEATIQAAQAVVKDLVEIPLKGIPISLLNDAQAVAIVPNVIKGSFVIGARRGNGVILVKSDDGNWHAPVFVTLTGGNVGWQIGVQSTDVVLVFRSRKSAESILNGKLTLGGDAAVAAGPVGRQAAAATDTRLSAEIYSYSRSRGLFAGVSFDGSVLRTDTQANSAYYGGQNPNNPASTPPSAEALVQQVAAYCGGNATAVASKPTAPASPIRTPANFERHDDELRAQLADTAPTLFKLLDEQWQNFLALPSGVFVGTEHPSNDDLQRSLKNFETVANDPRYRSLAESPQFDSTYALLRQYIAARQNVEPKLILPPPPGGNLR